MAEASGVGELKSVMCFVSPRPAGPDRASITLLGLFRKGIRGFRGQSWKAIMALHAIVRLASGRSAQVTRREMTTGDVRKVPLVFSSSDPAP